MTDAQFPQTLDIESYVDEVGADVIRGWAWVPGAPDDVVIIEVLDAAGKVVARTEASHYRGDLADAGKRGGACGFEVRFPQAAGLLSVRGRSTLAGVADVLLAEQAAGVSAPPRRSPFHLRGPDGVVGFLDRADEEEISGWLHPAAEFVEPLTVNLMEDGRILARMKADLWRTDLEDIRQGDGRCGFRFEPPSALYDGGEHRVDLCLADGSTLLEEPIVLRLSGAPAMDKAAPPALARAPLNARPVFSIIVNFYNMEREAARTLMSLSRRFQQGVEDIAYEVLCVDNGSHPPLQEAFVTAFGPEFRLIRPSAARPSPCAALNQAAAQARGRWLAIMIDGAHLVSPGTLREAHAALTAQPRAIVSLRQWFIGGDQRWFSTVGYSRAHEDVLFAKIDWPNQPYKIFDIAAPMYESANSWFDGMSESNCLFVPADLYRGIGGFDEAFQAPGAGFANLDLFSRCAEAAEAVIGLVGEASFHQYHGGVTTNVDDAEKDNRVRAYTSQYEQVRGAEFTNVMPDRIKLAGSIKIGSALTARQRTYCPAKLGMTTRVRPRPASIQFDQESQLYAQSAYVETGRHRQTRWRGLEVGVAPADLIEIQEALFRAAPEQVVMKETSLGLVTFVASILPTIGLPDTRIAWVTPEADARAPDGVLLIRGDPYAPETLRRVEDAIGDAEGVLALFQPGARDALPVEALGLYARFVSFNSYLIVLGAALGQPWLGYSRLWLHRAIVRFTKSGSSFVIDHTLNQHFITTCPSGFLRRVLDPIPAERYEEALDDLSGL